MADTFVPVDLDKLLDDFEEKDSTTSLAPTQQSSLTGGKEIGLKGFSSGEDGWLNGSDTSSTPQNRASSSSVSGVETKETTFLSPDESLKSLTPQNQDSLLLTNGIDTRPICREACYSKESTTFSTLNGDLHSPVPSNKSVSLNGQDSELSSPVTGTDKESCLISHDITTNRNSELLALDAQQSSLLVNGIDDAKEISSGALPLIPLPKTGVSEMDLENDTLLRNEQRLMQPKVGVEQTVAVSTESNSENNSKFSTLTSTCADLHPKTLAEDLTNRRVCNNSADESYSKDNTQSQEPSQSKDIVDMSAELLSEISGQTFRRLENNKEERTMSAGISVESSCSASNVDSESCLVAGIEHHMPADAQNSVDNGDKASCNNTADSSAPLAAAQETPSLVFLTDHFAGGHAREEVMDNLSSPVFDQEESVCASGASNANESDGESISSEQTEGPSAPVAHDVVAESSVLARNNSEITIPSQPCQLGYSPPQWIPDGDATRCMGCGCKFTVVRRRHHCRACGKVFCSACCNLKFNLQYLEDKLARVCQACANVLLQRQANLTSDEAVLSSTDESAMYVYLSPDQREVADAELVQPSPLANEEVEEDCQPPVYEDPGPQNAHVNPGMTVQPEDNVAEAQDACQVMQFRATTCSSSSSLSSADMPVTACTSTIPLPPLLKKTEEGMRIDNAPNHQEILYLLKKKKETVTFLLNKNLIVKVKIVKLNCCVKRKCWCFSSEGMGAVDQEDMVILLECVPKESCIPQDVLSHFNTAFAYARQGHRVTDLGYTIFGQPFLGSLRNAGFLYIKSSFQCLENVILPSGPHIFGILIQREEVSWVQLFPIRLILRLGAEYRYYPCPLWSVRDRAPLYGEIGHTIMDLLADFKNFQYTLPRVTGMHVHLEDKKTVIQLPQNRYDEVVKVLNSTDDYVMAFEATFSNVADSHLVCIQDGTGYKTQAINIEGQERKVTGASFIVFNGALKTTTEVKAKVSIVEVNLSYVVLIYDHLQAAVRNDGVMVQMVMQLSQEMRQAMREMRDFSINTGCTGNERAAVQEVLIEWVSKRNPERLSILSPIDGLTLGTTSDMKISTYFDYSNPSVYRLLLSQIFVLDAGEERPRNLSAHFKQTIGNVAKACTVALRPHLTSLIESGKRHIGLRVNLTPDMVGYTIGSQGTILPDEMTNDLDDELVPAIHSAVTSSSNAPTSMEFVFKIIEMLS